MTDRQKITALFDELGIGYDIEDDGSISLESNVNDKVKGYFGFSACFVFNEGGFKEIQLGEE